MEAELVSKRGCPVPPSGICVIFGIGAAIMIARMIKKKMRMMYWHHGTAPWRRFWTSEEKINKLEEYLKQLQMEEKAVQEKMDYLRKKASA